MKRFTPLLRGVAAIGVVAIGAAMIAPDASRAAPVDPFASGDNNAAMLGQALTLMREGDLEPAEKLLRNFIRLKPNVAQGYEYLGAVLVRTGRFKEALEAIDTALRLAPDQAGLHFNRGLVLLALKDAEGARQALEEAVRLDDEMIDAHRRLGTLYELKGDLDSAISHYESVVAGPAGDEPGVRINLASLYNRKGEFERAISLLVPWERDRSRFAVAHRILGDAFLGAGRIGPALTQFEMSLTIDDDNWQALLGLGAARRAEGDSDAALESFRKAAELAPDKAAPHIQIGETLVARGDVMSGIAALQEAARLSPAPVAIDVRIARLYRDAGQPEKSAEVFERMMERDGVSLAALIALADSRLEAGDDAAALAAMDRAIAEYPDRAVGPARKAIYLREIGDYDAAQAMIDEGFRREPESIDINREAGKLAMARGDFEKAMDFTEKVLSINPDSGADRFFLATLYDAAKQYDNAETLYGWIVANVPNHWPAMNNLALVQLRKGKLTTALDNARKASALQPDNPEVMHTLGYALFRNDRLGEAQAMLEAAVAKLPDVAVIHYNLGTVAFRRGKFDLAKRELTEGLRLDPEAEEAAEAREILDKL